MNLQTYLSSAAAVARHERFLQSDQLSLGELIEKLEPIVARQKDRIEEGLEESVVYFDFEYLFPTHFTSWRGIYEELALCFSSANYEKKIESMTVSDFLTLCKETVGKRFDGYKGGTYRMGIDTPIWVANYGNSGNTALVEVVDNGYTIILMTGYREV